MTVDAYDPNQIDFTIFSLFLSARRVHRGKTERRVARETRLTVDDVRRAERGRDPGADAFFALADWMGEPGTTFLKREARRV
jgi:transcriptional regulator with XRE-family HTH domain